MPLTVDLEGGYSDDPADVAALAAQLHALGVAGVNLEDGRPDGQLRPVAEHAVIISAVTAAAPELFVNARTDTYWLNVRPDNDRPRDTIHRLQAYRDAGASGVFTPGLTDLHVIEDVATRIALPLNVLWQPHANLAHLRSAGVARISTGSVLYRHALAAALRAAAAAGIGNQPADTPLTYDDVQQTLSRHDNR